MNMPIIIELIGRMKAPLMKKMLERGMTALMKSIYHQFVYGVLSVSLNYAIVMFIFIYHITYFLLQYTFVFCLNRMGGALKKAPSVDSLPVIGIDETVHDQSAYEDLAFI